MVDENKLAKLDRVLALVRLEVENAMIFHKPMNSLHEAYSVILEEVDEFWDEVKKNPRKHPERTEQAALEAKQVAAMAIRCLVDVC